MVCHRIRNNVEGDKGSIVYQRKGAKCVSSMGDRDKEQQCVRG